MRVFLLSAAFLLGLFLMGVAAAASAQPGTPREIEVRPGVSPDDQVHIIFALPKGENTEISIRTERLRAE